MKIVHVVCGIMKTDQGFLIARRGTGIHENMWEFPGGKVEGNESFEQAIVREIKEELHWNVKVIKPLCDVVDKRSSMRLLVHAYVCEYISGTLSLQAHHEVRFVQPSELSMFTFEEADHDILNAVVQEYS